MRWLGRRNSGKGHRNLLNLIEHAISDRFVWAVMEYARNGEFWEIIHANGPLSELAAVHYFRQAAAGVAHMHKHRVVHLDLSLENFLLDENMVLKICDFGQQLPRDTF